MQIPYFALHKKLRWPLRLNAGAAADTFFKSASEMLKMLLF